MFNAFWRNASQAPFTKGFKQGVLESFGWQYGKKGVYEGFLGRLGKGGMKANWLGGTIGIAGTAYAFYSGYQENGVLGGVKNVGIQTAISGAFTGIIRSAGTTLGNPVAVGVATAVAAGYAGYRLGEAGIAKAKRVRNLEMGSDIVDVFGTMSTMRQRSLSAIQNSHVNGRLALGGEASLMHTPYMR